MMNKVKSPDFRSSFPDHSGCWYQVSSSFESSSTEKANPSTERVNFPAKESFSLPELTEDEYRRARLSLEQEKIKKLEFIFSSLMIIAFGLILLVATSVMALMGFGE